MPRLDEVQQAAESLEPDDRLRLIVRLWGSLPSEHWAAPTAAEMAEIRHRLGDDDASRIAEVPWAIFQRFLANRSTAPRSKVYSAPRRFDLATIFVVTTAYSLLFAAMSGLNFPALASFCVAGFITGVGIGQAALFGGKKPRRASVVTGAALYFIGTLAFLYFDQQDFPGELIVVAVLNGVIVGSIMGYIAGVLVGGVFLVADALRGRFGHTGVDEAAEAAVESGPFSPSLHGPTVPRP